MSKLTPYEEAKLQIMLEENTIKKWYVWIMIFSVCVICATALIISIQ